MLSSLCIFGFTALALVSGQDLSAVGGRAGVKIWRDRGGTSGNDLTIYEPVRSGNDYYVLGQRAQPDYENLNRDLHAFKDDSRKRDAFARPEGFRFLYDTRGSTYAYDASCWRPICPRGYWPLSDFFYNREGLSTPPSSMFAKIRCVNERYVDDCDIGNKIWTNSGTIGRFYASIWNINRRRDQFPTFFFHLRDQHNERPNIRAKCLKSRDVRLRFY